MRAINTIRHMDELGRITIPHEVREHFGWRDGAVFQVFIGDQSVILRRHDIEPNSHCFLCGSTEKLLNLPGDERKMCFDCWDNTR
ncbi:hypothetical protein SD51_12155 [Alicyclobacillus tengchongensis]|nr:hypothetical protein SD51_12155 [Alicyclobacillus tengchongensis]